MDISLLKINPSNPRIIKDDKFKKLVQSIKEFPEMLEKRPIVVNKDYVVLGGNMRLKACIEAGLKEVPVIVADWSEEKQREFIIKDNVSVAEWDWDDLSINWDVEKLEEWGLDVPNFESSNVDISDKIEESYKIEISCADETQQEKTYNELIAKGYNCRLLSL